MSDPPEPPRRRVGRPPVDPRDTSVNVHLMLESRTYDRAYQLARAMNLTVPELLRRAIRLTLNPSDK